ncbi:hypothetical protein BaRGS_00019535 [Batillaria attramentaria]|uniref:Uncharacterized protein n=1 Tax=Batillaria attramentaria TaxID=370345 RepID=A0ABD0KPS3_9CAEN
MGLLVVAVVLSVVMADPVTPKFAGVGRGMTQVVTPKLVGAMSAGETSRLPDTVEEVLLLGERMGLKREKLANFYHSELERRRLVQDAEAERFARDRQAEREHQLGLEWMRLGVRSQ